jgi:hypothetical protein
MEEYVNIGGYGNEPIKKVKKKPKKFTKEEIKEILKKNKEKKI